VAVAVVVVEVAEVAVTAMTPLVTAVFPLSAAPNPSHLLKFKLLSLPVVVLLQSFIMMKKRCPMRSSAGTVDQSTCSCAGLTPFATLEETCVRVITTTLT
jgi:hypothetical protein